LAAAQKAELSQLTRKLHKYKRNTRTWEQQRKEPGSSFKVAKIYTRSIPRAWKDDRVCAGECTSK